MALAETSSSRNARLWSEDGFREDSWRRSDSADEAEDGARIILPLSAFLALEPDYREANLPRLGVEIMPGESIEALLPFLHRLTLIALAFPVFNDGRSYSKAELLRSRHGFKGELRATGDVLLDQVAHMLRCGFSTLEVKNPVVVRRLSSGDPAGMSLYYQPSVATPGKPGKYAWRRA
ncbi:DUF934 domain-containing protein [Chelativorans sp. Marseille-P2723]|uniref:DUF934 domain-containing protein n=1 Tax=Chelativorans sp. Marseille-P2723 TaxID=2709133 RepID=UPI00156FAAAB|nr:DUF934 domain-containing protein [Chelativorans sp. Marseille-P2723]